MVHLPRVLNGQEPCCYPVIVVSSPAFNAMPFRIVVPLIAWRPEFEGRIDKFRIDPNKGNNLKTESVADFLRVNSVPTDCFVSKTGILDAEEVEEVVAGIVIAVDYRP